MARPPITAKGEGLFRRQLEAALDYVESLGGGGSGGATDLGYTAATRVLTSSTGTDVTLPLVSSSAAGLSPASGGGTTNFLRADGSWAAPPSGGGSPIISWVI